MECLNVILHDNVFATPDDLFNKLEAEIQYLPAAQTRVCIQGKSYAIPREIAAFGDPFLTYTFSGLTVDCQPWTPLLLEIKSAIETLTGDTYNFVLVNRYKDGSSCIGQHKDAEKDLDPNYSIASLSLGATRKMVFKRPHYGDYCVDLEHNTLLVMKPPTNRDWTHGIPRQKDVKGVRLNLTFRKIVNCRDKRKIPVEETTDTCKKAKQEDSKGCGVFTEDNLPADVIPVGEDVFITVSHFRGNVAVHLRRYKKYGKTFYPTKEGVTLQPWWIPYIMGRQDIPQTAKDLQGSVFLPEDQLQIQSEDFENFTLTRINLSKQTETVKTITITANQWRQMLIQYKIISTVVVDYVFRSINFVHVYMNLFSVATEEDGISKSLDVSLGRQYLLDTLQRVLCDTLKTNSGMKDPEIMDCEEVWGNRVETLNTTALALDINDIVHNFNDALVEDQPFLALKPCHYVTTAFLKMIQFDIILKQVRKILCPAGVFEYFEDFL